MEYSERTYRTRFFSDDLKYFNVKIKETDLCLGVSSRNYSEELKQIVLVEVRKLRKEMEEYIDRNPLFRTSLVPLKFDIRAPEIAKEMFKAAQTANVGPMAAVAGAFAQKIGMILSRYSSEVIVENGGDLYIRTTKKRCIGIFAGTSPFTNRIGIEIKPEYSPVGLCTSSGTVGPSLSFGKSDASIIISKNDASLADALATAVGNVIQTPEDLQKAAEIASGFPGIIGAIAIKDDKMALWGDVSIVPIDLARL